MTYTVEAKVLKTSLNTTNKDIKLAYKDLISLYLEMKEYEQRVTTFGKEFLKYVNPVTGRLHSNINQIVSTGRSSSRSPNLQNIPSDSRYRECFIAPPGHKIVNADFSGQENIVLVNKSLDKDLLSFYESGNSDMHSFIASKIYNKPYDDYIAAKDKKDSKQPLNDAEKLLLKERGISKAAGFAINYGGNGYTISTNLGVTLEVGEFVYDAYFKAFPGLREYFDKTIDKTMKLGYVPINDITGRRLNLSKFNKMKSLEQSLPTATRAKHSEYYKLKAAISRLALNAPIQGTAGDITKNAAIRFRKWIYDNKYEESVFTTNIIHDEINVECPTSISELVATKLQLSMEAAGALWCKTVPLKADAQIKDFWTH
jgi:DNA polymerase-1